VYRDKNKVIRQAGNPIPDINRVARDDRRLRSNEKEQGENVWENEKIKMKELYLHPAFFRIDLSIYGLCETKVYTNSLYQLFIAILFC
jgi:hypothetical protein